MKRVIMISIFGLSIATLVSAWSWFGFNGDPKLRAVNRLMARLAKEIYSEFGLRACIDGVSTRHGVSNITLYFDYQGPLELEEAKRLVVLCAERMVQRMNEDEDVRPYLVQYPVTVRNITTGIFNKDQDGREAYPPYPGFIGVNIAKLIVNYCDPGNQYGVINETYEPYEEAKAKILGEDQSAEKLGT